MKHRAEGSVESAVTGKMTENIRLFLKVLEVQGQPGEEVEGLLGEEVQGQPGEEAQGRSHSSSSKCPMEKNS